MTIGVREIIVLFTFLMILNDESWNKSKNNIIAIEIITKWKSFNDFLEKTSILAEM